MVKIHHLCAILAISKSKKEQTRLGIHDSQYRDGLNGALRPRAVRALLFKRDDRGIARKTADGKVEG